MTSHAASSPAAVPPVGSVLSPSFRAATLGMVALVSLIAFEALAVATAMPTVARELDGLRLYAFAFGGTLATSVIGMTLAGRWSDARGPAQPLWTGLACFVAGLLLAGLAPDMPTLIGGRLLQGLGAGTLFVTLYVVVARLYPEALRPRIFAAFSAAWVLPSLLGPTLAGLIVQHVGWRWVFLAVPMLAIPAALLLRPTVRRLAAEDPRGAVLDRTVLWAIGASIGILLLYAGGQMHGAIAVPLLLPAAALLGLCSWKLLPAGTLRLRRGLPSVIALRGLAGAAFFGCEAFLPLLLSRERGLSPWLAGVALSVGALGWAAGSWYQGHTRRGWSRRQLLQTGALAMAAGIGLTGLAMIAAVPVAVAIAGWVLTGLGMGLVYPSLSVLTLSLSPPAQQGRNSSALQLSEAIAVATTLAVSGSLFAWLLAHAVWLGYLLNFAIAGALALMALWVARRV
ncbi:MFS transporter [Flavobacterium sp. MXW15]|uniref:MFS transporter n=1 Tax=Xanthomonas chitinilytica TaxID=2989819 RepID=A0ABT3JUH0_9XANT|nr:MFS transporter [Xanthomonas sp. H13-6]MCW4453526.1 MFS transporter [Flavobacterium sp. MXW15]MCW4472121.1 MFS transporter [Xanthomonas sp. H13-6]